MPPSFLTLTAPAKINLRLTITGQRADGYHLLEMLNVPVALADDIVASRQSPVASKIVDRRPETGDRQHSFTEGGITLLCDHPDVPLNATNLCYRAAEAMRAASGHRDSVAIQLTKRIPIGGGLGGGSSNAAAVLAGCNQLWGLKWSTERLAELGVQFGADIPFFCHGRPAWVEGIGEQVTIYEQFPKLWILLVNPRLNISTKWAYQQYDLNLTASTPHGTSRPRFFEGFEQVTHLCANNLEAVVEKQYPVIRQMRDALVSAGAVCAQMSGSGATVFGLFATQTARDAAASQFAQREWLIIPTESVGGA